MGSLVGEGLDLKTVGLGSRKKRVGLSRRCPRGVTLTTLLSPTGSEGKLGTESDSSKSREPHFEVGSQILLDAKRETRRQRLVLDLIDAKSRW